MLKKVPEVGMLDTNALGSASNPFQILTLIVAPALLTNSSSLLSLSTSNRFARTVDRARFLYEKMKSPQLLSPHELSIYQKQLPIMERRSLLLVSALTCFYVAVGSFAATSFTSLIGAAVSFFDHALASQITMIAALVCGCFGVLGLVAGAGMLVREMWLALYFMKIESKLSEGIQVNPII